MTEINTEIKEAPHVPVVTEITQTQQAQPTETIEEVNWRKFRQQREEERKQKDEAVKYAQKKEEETAALKLAMEALVNKPSRQQDNEEEISEDQRIDLMVERKLKQREDHNEKIRAEKEYKELPQKLKKTYSDFDDLCTPENLDYLEYHYPEVATPYKHMADSFEKWQGLYQAVKKFIPNKNSVKDAKKMEANLAKPQAMSRPGATQTGDHAPTTQLTDERRQANWERMQKNMGKGGIG
jgi:hypothetical protein